MRLKKRLFNESVQNKVYLPKFEMKSTTVSISAFAYFKTLVRRNHFVQKLRVERQASHRSQKPAVTLNKKHYLFLKTCSTKNKHN